MANQGDIMGLNESEVDGKQPPSRKIVDWLHAQVSTIKQTDIHHHIGFSEGDAAAGNHNHDGKNSVPLFDATEVILTDLTTGATNAQIVTAINKINAALRDKGAGG